MVESSDAVEGQVRFFFIIIWSFGFKVKFFFIIMWSFGFKVKSYLHG